MRNDGTIIPGAQPVITDRFFRDLTVNRIRRGAFTSVPDLELALHDYVRVHNREPKPQNFRVWYVSQRALTLVFNEYQVAAYVAGAQKVEIPWSEVRGIVHALSPVRYLSR